MDHIKISDPLAFHDKVGACGSQDAEAAPRGDRPPDASSQRAAAAAASAAADAADLAAATAAAAQQQHIRGACLATFGRPFRACYAAYDE